MSQNQNQFSQNGEQGSLDLRFNANIIAGAVDVSESGSLLPGQAITLVDSAGGVPKVIAATADTDDIFGFIVYDIKSVEFVAGDLVEIAILSSNVMYMTAGAAIARNAEIEVVIASTKVITAVSLARIVGRALDKAAADGDLIRVAIILPGALKA